MSVKCASYHEGCGIVDVEVITEADGSKWEVCEKCGETIREAKP